ncbi:RNA 2',3'-cyclic phosphodiesterase [Paenibacillus eucommiae]|uniref:RNA 2',3'-cyclic phosphodiesterase n=1 Tax=Paenibacillus eucommiae TaxID=1355755 RepID=A0ABS4IRE3_9BACL|nr:RNA 2',3'-cyclic phosphodiesterase [Paenibacillus eucommiae]MBP1989581.1 2'-5' RNA ligase [Paenibacillus eucommiae]
MNAINQVRLFVAVPVLSGIKHAVAGWIDEIKSHLPFRKWVHHEDLHITLQFLGDTPSERVPHITQALEEISAVSTPLSLRVESLGFFGRPTQPAVLWAGVGGDVEGLHSLQQRVVSALMPLGFMPEERTFHPHLTLARNYTSTAPFDLNKLSDFPIPPSLQGDLLEWKSKEVTLYRSHLNKLPMYEAISVISG